MESPNTCAVCYEDYSVNELFILSCHHRFDSGCLNHILESNNHCCPLCRKDFNYNTIVAIKTYNSIIKNDKSLFNNITFMLDLMPKLNLKESSLMLDYLMNFQYNVDIDFKKLYIYDFRFSKYKIVSYTENEQKIKYKIHFMVSIEIITTDTNNALIMFKNRVPKAYRKFITDVEFINKVCCTDYKDYDLSKNCRIKDYFAVTLDEKVDKLTVHYFQCMMNLDIIDNIISGTNAIHIRNKKNEKYYTVNDNLLPLPRNDKIYCADKIFFKPVRF